MEVLKKRNPNRLDHRSYPRLNEAENKRISSPNTVIWSALYSLVELLFIIVGNNNTIQNSTKGIPYSFQAEKVPYTPSSDPIGIQFSNRTIPNFGMNDTNSDECLFLLTSSF